MSAQLTANEARSREVIASLRGYASQLRNALADAVDQAPPGTSLHYILQKALAIPIPGEENG